MEDHTTGVRRTATSKSQPARCFRAGLLVAVAAFTLGVAPGLGGRASAAPLSLHHQSSAYGQPTQKPVHRPATATTKSQVKISNFKFGPRTLTVKVGTKVTWINKDAIGHSVNFSTGNVNSKTLDQNAKFSHTFTAAGTYQYICDIHPFMHGTVVVTA